MEEHGFAFVYLCISMYMRSNKYLQETEYISFNIIGDGNRKENIITTTK